MRNPELHVRGVAPERDVVGRHPAELLLSHQACRAEDVLQLLRKVGREQLAERQAHVQVLGEIGESGVGRSRFGHRRIDLLVEIKGRELGAVEEDPATRAVAPRDVDARPVRPP